MNQLTDALRQIFRRYGARPVSVPAASEIQRGPRLLGTDGELHGPRTFVLGHRSVIEFHVVWAGYIHGIRKRPAC